MCSSFHCTQVSRLSTQFSKSSWQCDGGSVYFLSALAALAHVIQSWQRGMTYIQISQCHDDPIVLSWWHHRSVRRLSGSPISQLTLWIGSVFFYSASIVIYRSTRVTSLDLFLVKMGETNGIAFYFRLFRKIYLCLKSKQQNERCIKSVRNVVQLFCGKSNTREAQMFYFVFNKYLRNSIWRCDWRKRHFETNSQGLRYLLWKWS